MVKGTGMSEVVENEQIGVVIDYSEEGFGQGLSMLLDMEDNWKDMSIRMNNLYLEKYNWEVMKSRLVQLYDSIE